MEFCVAVQNYGIKIKEAIRSATEVIGVPYGACEVPSIKSYTKMRTKAMERVFIYGYISFAFGVLLLIGLVVFTWIALKKICCDSVR
jgi:hypothetical protein